MQEVSSNSQVSAKPKISLFVFALIGFVMLATAGYLYLNSNKENSNNTQNNNEAVVAEEKSKMISLSEISEHKTKTDCWTTINGEVFDLTKFISIHKGGDKILNACGVDATDYFTGKHPTIGRVHSQVAVKLLQGMKIGDLQK
ncbi:MAG: cytochrome b5-like heme/steroid binding domain-containing protein [Microgenomates group bacterium]